MAVLKKIRSRWWAQGEESAEPLTEYESLLPAPESVSYRAVTQGGGMVGFIIGLVDPDHTGHVTTVGVAPEHRRRGVAHRLMAKVEDGFRRRDVRLVRLEVRTLN